jgi:hypothetical protein
VSDWKRRRRDPTRVPAPALPDLVCVECGRRAPRGAPGWRACLTLEDDGSAQTAVYCPDCARVVGAAQIELDAAERASASLGIEPGPFSVCADRTPIT